MPKSTKALTHKRIKKGKYFVGEDSLLFLSALDADWTEEWSDALMGLLGWCRSGLVRWSYTGKYDPKPLAKALKKGNRVPRPIQSFMANVIDPPEEWRGPRLKFAPAGKRDHRIQFYETGLMLHVREEYQLRKKAGEKYDSIVDDLSAETGRGKSWIKAAIALTNEEAAQRVLKAE